MKALLRWLAKIVGSALTLVLVIVLFPHISRIAARLLPDESGAAIKASAILAEKLENSSRLETMKVQADGVLNYDIQAAFIGTVANINASYQYNGSFGIDLKAVAIQADGNDLTFILPLPEVIQDSLTPDEVHRNDFWYPGFSDQDYEQLMEAERLVCRERYLSGEYADQLWSATLAAFQQTIAPWIQHAAPSLVLNYEQATITENLSDH